MSKRFNRIQIIALLAILLSTITANALARQAAWEPLPDSPQFESYVYNPKDHTVSGKITGTDTPKKYGVVIFIQVPGSDIWWVKPDFDHCVTPVDGNRLFSAKAYTAGEVSDKNAAYYTICLVDKSFKLSNPNDLDGALAAAYDFKSEQPTDPTTPRFESAAYTEDHYVEGRVLGDYSNLDLLLFIHVESAGYWIKPSIDGARSPILKDGYFRIQAYSPDAPNDLLADEFEIYLVNKGFQLNGPSDIDGARAAALAYTIGSTDPIDSTVPHDMLTSTPAIEPISTPTPTPIPPHFDTTSIYYDEADNYVKGTVLGDPSDLSNCNIMLFIYVPNSGDNCWWVKPTLADQLSPVNPVDGSFYIQAYSDYPPEAYYSDVTYATKYELYLVNDGQTVGVHGHDKVKSIDAYKGVRGQ